MINIHKHVQLRENINRIYRLILPCKTAYYCSIHGRDMSCSFTFFCFFYKPFSTNSDLLLRTRGQYTLIQLCSFLPQTIAAPWHHIWARMPGRGHSTPLGTNHYDRINHAANSDNIMPGSSTTRCMTAGSWSHSRRLYMPAKRTHAPPRACWQCFLSGRHSSMTSQIVWCDDVSHSFVL